MKSLTWRSLSAVCMQEYELLEVLKMAAPFSNSFCGVLLIWNLSLSLKGLAVGPFRKQTRKGREQQVTERLVGFLSISAAQIPESIPYISHTVMCSMHYCADDVLIICKGNYAECYL
ncbi:hypothetical protein FKM82_029312 [Ascaphus truei]